MARGGPGGFDVNALMKQAQQMQSEMLKRRSSSRTRSSRPAPGAAWSR
jgi:DNA-binding protein YbaB